MSRIGIKPIQIPKGVTVTVDGNVVTVKGPKGTLTRQVHPDMIVTVADGQVRVQRPSDENKHKALHGLTRTLIANMVQGVTEGYSKTLEINGMGYRASLSGGKLVLNLGFIKPVEIVPPPNIKIEVPAPNTVTISGIDKEQVGQLAANIRRLRPPEPYKGTGIKYAGEKIRRKVAKSGK